MSYLTVTVVKRSEDDNGLLKFITEDFAHQAMKYHLKCTEGGASQFTAVDLDTDSRS